MKRRAVYFLLCLCFCFYSVSLSSSAVNEHTIDDLIDRGFVEDSPSKFVYTGDDDPLSAGISLFLQSHRNYSFDYNSLPWESFPDYVTELYDLGDGYYPYSADSTSGISDDKIPFFLIRVGNHSYVQIFAGYNIALGRANDNIGGLYIYAYPSLFSKGTACYFAEYDFSGNCITDWRSLQFNYFNTTSQPGNKLGRYWASAIGGYEFYEDYYFFGGNAIDPTPVNDNAHTTVTFPIDSAAGSFVYVRQDILGFTSDKYFSSQTDPNYHYIHCETFKPISPEDVSNEREKGIWETLKSIPDTIAEKIKGLFVPSDDFFNTYQQDFQSYFNERFGILYEIPELIINLLTKIMTFNPEDDNYSITFPELVLPVLEDGQWRNVTLIQEQDYSFDIINQAPFSLLYDIYVAFIWLMYILLLVNLVKNKANHVFKGG